MNRLFAGYSMWLKVLIALGFSAQFAISTASANAVPTMLSIPTQTIVAEQLFTYRIVVWAADTGQPAGLRLINAPKGATLTDNEDGSHEFRWTPPADVGEQTVIIVQAFSIAEPNLVSTQRVVFQRGSAAQVQAPTVTAGVVVASNSDTESRLLTPATAADSAISDNTTAVNATPVEAALSAATQSTSTPVKIETNASNAASTGYESKFKTKPAVTADAKQPKAITNSIESGSSIAESSKPDAITTPSSSTAPVANVETMTDTTVSDRPELPEIDLQSLTVGEEFQFFVRPIAEDDAQVQLSVESLPVGATFEDVFEGNKMLRWTPTPDQVGEHQMLLVLVAEDADAVSLRTEREVMFAVEPAPPVEREPELVLEPMSAQIVSAGRKVNIRVEPKTTDDKIALLQVDRLPAGGSFDENKDGTRTFHWPTTQADQGEHTFRFTAIHPENPELVSSVDVLIVVGSPDGVNSGPSNLIASGISSPSPELDEYPSADSPSPSAALASPESPSSLDSPSPEPYPTADTASPEPLAVRPLPPPLPPPPRPTP